MSEITKNDVIITLGPQNRNVSLGHKSIDLPVIAFGGGGGTYPEGGIPLPGKEHFGYKRSIDRVLIQQPVDPKLTYRYDAENHTIRIFTAEAAATTNLMTEVAAEAAVAEAELPVVTIGE